MVCAAIFVNLLLILVECHLQDLKEYTDAEGLMSLPTSDFEKHTVCSGRYKYSISNSDGNAMMRCITATTAASGATPKSVFMQDANDLSTMTLPIEAPFQLANTPSNGGHIDRPNHYGNNLMKANLNNSGDLASVDSSDTYASCQTHPFLSQGDLTGDIMADINCTLAELDADDLYFTTLDRDRPSTSADIKTKSQVKKSASGDASLLSLGACPPMDEVLVSIFKKPFWTKSSCKSEFSHRKHFSHLKWHRESIVAVMSA